MKKILIAGFIILGFVGNVCADTWYIVRSADYEIVSKQNGPPNEEAINADGYFSIKEKTDLDFSEAEYRNGKVVKRTVTQQELSDKAAKEEKDQELNIVYKKALKIAYEELKATGTVFKQIKDTDFE